MTKTKLQVTQAKNTSAYWPRMTQAKTTISFIRNKTISLSFRSRDSSQQLPSVEDAKCASAYCTQMHRVKWL